MTKYYLYIDECGDQNLSNFEPTFPIFTLCGILMREDKDVVVREQINSLKRKFWGEKDIVLHSRDIRKCQKGFEILFDLNVKKSFYEDLNKILGQEGLYVIVCCCILKEPYIRQFGKMNDVYSQSLSFLLERVVFCLDNQKGDGEIELHTMVEKRGKKEDKVLAEFYNQMLSKGTYWVSPDRLRAYCKTFNSVPKKANIVGLQLADLVAYPITRHVLNPNEVNFAYDIIKANIYTQDGKQKGLRVFPVETLADDTKKRIIRTDNPFQPGTPQSIIEANSDVLGAKL